jgi:hypothetical protein
MTVYRWRQLEEEVRQRYLERSAAERRPLPKMLTGRDLEIRVRREEVLQAICNIYWGAEAEK